MVTIQQWQFATVQPFILIHLHSNESTAGNAAKEISQEWGIPLIQLINNETRMVSFKREGRFYQFDPNRIFSPEGIFKTLTLSSAYTTEAFEEVKQFSDSLLSLFGKDKPLVAVHNNTDGRFNILQYRNAGIGQTHVNRTLDEDDFFITNDEEIFSLLKEKDFNVVLENASAMEEDGSLSLYCGRSRQRYINVEAQHGHSSQQLAMLEAVVQILK